MYLVIFFFVSVWSIYSLNCVHKAEDSHERAVRRRVHTFYYLFILLSCLLILPDEQFGTLR
jgi:hypothetical protein